MGQDLFGKQVLNTYDAIIKVGDNDTLTGIAKQLSDGRGNDAPIWLSTARMGIGITPDTNYTLTVNGAAKIGSLDVTGAVTAASVQLTGGSGNQGLMTWNTDEETVDIVQNGATLQVGQEVQVHVKNQTGALIPDGTPVYVTGTLGSSGRLTVAPMIADGTIEAKYFLGITTEDIGDGEDGKVTTFGKIRGLNTDAYTEGTTLYVSATTAGAWQTTPPAAPNLDLEVAIVINSHVNNGTIFVRATNGQYLGLLHDVYLNSPANNQFLVYNSTTSRWENQGIASVGSINLDTVTDNGNTTTNNINVGDISAGNMTLSGYLRGGETFVIDPSAYGDNTGTVQILGNLIVEGETTTINSTTVTIDDKNLVLASGAADANAANGAGITIDGAAATMTYVSTSDRFVFNKDIETNLVGNADTASTLATARNIEIDGAVTGNADFDGSGDITITTTVNHNHDDRYYTETEADTRFVNVDGDTMTGDLNLNGGVLKVGNVTTIDASRNIFANDITANELFATSVDFEDLFLTNASGGSLVFRNSQGNTVDTENLATVSFQGYYDSAFVGASRIQVKANEDFSATARGTVINFDFWDTGSTYETIASIDSSGLYIGTTNVYDNLPDGITYSDTDNRLKIGVSKNVGSTTETAIQPILLADILNDGFIPYIATGGAGSATVNSRVSDSWLKINSDTLELGASDPVSHEIRYARFLWQSGTNDKISTVYGAKDITASIQYLGGSTTAKIEFTGGSGGGRIQFNDEYTFPATDGTSGQVLSTNGSGDLSWVAAGGPTTSDLDDVTTNGNTTTNDLTTGNLFVGTSTSANYISFRGTTGDDQTVHTHSFIGEYLYGGAGTELAELLLFKGNDPATPSGPDRIRYVGSTHVFQTYTTGIQGDFATIAASTTPVTRLTINNDGGIVATESLTAGSFIKSGGTSSQFLKADGSVDSNTYLTSYTEIDTLQTVTDRGNSTSNNISVGGYLDLTGILYTRSNLEVLNAAGNGWNTWASRDAGTGKYNLSAQNVTSDSSTITGSLTVSSANTTGGGIILADDGDIVDLNDGWASMRFSRGVRIYNGNKSGTITTQLGNGTIASAYTYFLTDVGIGIASPSKKLHVYSSGNEVAFFQGTSGGAWIDIQSSTSNLWSIGAVDANYMGIYNRTNSSYPMVISNGGNVGIGTTSPSEKLAVVGNIVVGAGYNGGIYADSNGTGSSDTNWGFQIQRTSGVDDYNVRMKFYPAAGTARKLGLYDGRNNSWILYADGNANSNCGVVASGDFTINGNLFMGKAGDPRIYAGSGVGFNIDGEQLYLNRYTSSNIVMATGGGNVGIKTTDPQFDLHVGGANARLRVGPYYTSGGDRDFVDLIADGQNSKILSNNERFHIENNSGDIVIMPSGSVGIGTTTPLSNLHIKTATQNDVPTAGTGAVKGLYVSNDLDTYGMMIGSISNGNGYIQQQRTNTVTYYNLLLQPNGGNVGIGTTTPSRPLDVNGDTGAHRFISTSNMVAFTGSGLSSDGYPYARIVEAWGVSFQPQDPRWAPNVSGASFLVGAISGGANYGIGNIRATGDVVAFASDRRLKTNIKPIENALDRVMKLNGVYYNWDLELCNKWDFHPTDKVESGVIAQEVQEVFPEVVQQAPFDCTGDEEGNIVSKSGEDYLTVKYEKLVPLLIEAIKEQQKQIDELKARLDGSTY